MARRAGGDVAIWESPQPLVVVGRSSRIETEVRAMLAAHSGHPHSAASSGGASIIAGPGCLMYAVVLSSHAAALRPLSQAHREVLGLWRRPWSRWRPACECCGTSDLAVGDGHKFSGNSARAAAITCCTTARCSTTFRWN